MKKFLAMLLVATFPCLAEVEKTRCTVDTETELCRDLTHAQVNIRQLSGYLVRKHCGWGAVACADLRLSTTRGATCDIYIRQSRLRHDLIHELNHCRGWNHVGHRHHKPWEIMQAVTMLAELQHRPVTVKQNTAKETP